MNDHSVIRLLKRVAGEDETWSVQEVETKRLFLKVEAYNQSYHFYYALEPEKWHVLYEDVDG